MRVAFAYRYGILGGVCTQLLNRLAGFRSQPGVEVHLAFGRDHGISAALADHPHVLFAKRAKDFGSYCRREAIDVVSIIDTPELIGACRSLFRRRRLILEVHTTYAPGLEYLDELRRRRPGIQAVVVPSAYSERLVRHHLGNLAPIHRVGNCVDPNLFRPSDAAGDGPPVCLWVGKLDEHKNWRGFLAIAAALHRMNGEIRFWMVGGLTAPDAVKREFVEEIERLDLGEALRWTPVLPYSEMPRVYQHVAASGGLSVVTSRDESFGMSVAESLMCGCPVVAADVGALSELCVEGEGLAMYSPGEIDAAVHHIAGRLEAGAPPLEMRQSMHDRLATRLSPHTVCASLSRVFHSSGELAHA